MQPDFSRPVKASLNFTAGKAPIAISNTDPARTTSLLAPLEVEIRNIRSLSRKPTLQTEGFTLAAHSSGQGDWPNVAWLDSAYVPTCQELVKKLAGAKTTVSMGIVQRQAGVSFVGQETNYGNHGRRPAVFQAHLDQARERTRSLVERFAKPHNIKFKEAAIYNVWKATSPAPQDTPLTVADWRTVLAGDFVRVEVDEDKNTSYVGLAKPSEPAKWYYVPDLDINESLVFVGADTNENHPLGCPHTAFKQPNPGVHETPRTSIEVRVVAYFD